MAANIHEDYENGGVLMVSALVESEEWIMDSVKRLNPIAEAYHLI